MTSSSKIVETPSKTLLTSLELKQLYGKIRSLEKLKKLPKAQNAATSTLVQRIEISFVQLLKYAKRQFNLKMRQKVDKQLQNVKIWENVVIQHVILERSIEDLVAESIRARNRKNL